MLITRSQGVRKLAPLMASALAVNKAPHLP